MRFKNEQLEMANEALRNIVDLQDEMILQDTDEREILDHLENAITELHLVKDLM